MSQNLYAADCAVGYTATNGATLTHSTWNSEFGNAISCINNRLEEAGGNMTGNLNIYGGYDIIWYSDSGSTQKAMVDGATGNATFNDVILGSTDKLYLDGVSGNTYRTEETTDEVKDYVGGVAALRMTTTAVNPKLNVNLEATKRLYYDGGGNTYRVEESADEIKDYVGGVAALRLVTTAVNPKLDLVVESGKKVYYDGGGDTYRIHPSSDQLDDYVGGQLVESSSASATVFYKNVYMQGLETVPSSDVPVTINTTNGKIYQEGTSSERYKEEIVNISEDLDTSKIYQLRPVSFYYKTADPNTRSKEVGLIAEEVAAIYPRLVVYNSKNQPDGVRYQKLPILLLAEIQKMKNQIINLQAEVNVLKNINNNSTQSIQEPVGNAPLDENAVEQ